MEQRQDDPRAQAAGPAWLVDAIGIDYFSNVVWVLVTNAPDDVLMHIGNLRHLQFVVITKREVTTGLAHLAGTNQYPCASISTSATLRSPTPTLHI